MAQIYCSNCGNLCNDGASFCNKCGNKLYYPEERSTVQVNNQNYNGTIQTVNNQQRSKIPGRGLGISSLVLGIIGVVFGVLALDYEISYQYYSLFNEDIIFVTLPILSTVFGFTSRKRGYMYGSSLSGLILGIIGISLFALTALIGL